MNSEHRTCDEKRRRFWFLRRTRHMFTVARPHLAVHGRVVAVLRRAETPRLPAPPPRRVHPARFLRRGAQLSVLQLQTRQVKGQRPLHGAQVVQQPESDALRSDGRGQDDSHGDFYSGSRRPHLQLPEFEVTQVNQRQTLVQSSEIFLRFASLPLEADEVGDEVAADRTPPS
ncbi:hypothetical protein EYF80_011493 [Liparis tanakae]|uniref:Uncharacterized protein n=1 Tax=Liparis tanakae TaxID=230148 RepID=A0A4Z2IM77_9TELE|nr:hypothetical protein EYF80_011493 [Liparis tanakae]